jgi:hypothetical protein
VSSEPKAESASLEVQRAYARYALRLDLDRDPGRGALARWPFVAGSAVAGVGIKESWLLGRLGASR